MKSFFIETKKKFNISELNQSLAKLDYDILPKKIGLVSTVQFLPLIKEVERSLLNKGKSVFKAKTLFNEAQVLGCNISAGEKIKDKVDAFLILSTGKWHALMLSALGKKVFIFNGESIEKLPQEAIERFNTKKKVALIKFLSESKVGILVSLKYGQFNLKSAFKIKEKIEKMGKEAEIFIFDTLNLSELENFDIKVWINTACPGIFFDSSNIINIQDLPQ
jgi:2-(3-amino-3-carboxypropyl)histidine synthase